jgi:hypothetical protein
MSTHRGFGSLRRWEDEGGAPFARRSREDKRASPSPAQTALYYFNIRTDVGVLDTDSEGLTLPDLTSALHEALALARQSLLEGDRTGKDRRRWQVEIMDRGNQHLLSVKFAEVSACELPVLPNEDRSGGKRSH